MSRQLFYADAIREGLKQEMERDDSVYIFGEDVAAYGGVFGVTKDLLAQFGPMRVRNTPLSEAAIVGEAIGAAVYGLRPVPEINGDLRVAVDPSRRRCSNVRELGPERHGLLHQECRRGAREEHRDEKMDAAAFLDVIRGHTPQHNSKLPTE